MRRVLCFGLLFLAGSLLAHAADKTEFRERRQRAVAAALFHEGILLVHARSVLELSGDGFRQDPAFYYLAGLENTASALLAIDGRSGQSSQEERCLGRSGHLREACALRFRDHALRPQLSDSATKTEDRRLRHSFLLLVAAERGSCAVKSPGTSVARRTRCASTRHPTAFRSIYAKFPTLLSPLG